jgi:hypothetical protein
VRLAPAGVVVLAVACVGSRGTKTLQPSAEEAIPASPSVTFQAAVKAVTDQGLPLRDAQPSTRVIQTDYVDILSFDPMGAAQYPTSERLVRFRVIVGPNPEGAGSVVAIYGIYAPFRTGFGTSDRNERAIPRDHPAMRIVRRIRDDVAKAAGM